MALLDRVPSVTMFSDMLRRDRERSGLRIARVAWRLGITPAEYRRLEEEEAWPRFETYDRICKLFGWPQTFTGLRAGSRNDQGRASARP